MILSGYDVYIRRIMENGKVIFPEAFCLTEAERIKVLESGIELESIERLKSSIKSKFYGQYLNDPLDDALIEFKKDWFQSFQIQPGSTLAQEFPQAPVLISLDPAFRLSQMNDFSGLVITKTLSDNNVYILEAKGIKANPQMLIEEIFRLVDKYVHIDKVLVETVTSQILFMDLLQAEMRRRNKFFILQEVKPTTNETKITRIRGLISHYSNRRIFHSPGLWELEEQLMEFPRGMHDDIIDALAYQIKFWRPFNMEQHQIDVPYGSYAWWHKKSTKTPTVLGKLFRDIR